MTNYQLIFYNDDGSITPEYRERLRQQGASEAEINRIESVNMRHARVEQEQAHLKEQHRKDGEEWDRQYEAHKKEKERLGIKPTFKILYVSPDRINVNDMNPSQRETYGRSGLSTEERLSQGYIEPGNIRSRSYNTNKDEDEGYIPENLPPEIPF